MSTDSDETEGGDSAHAKGAGTRSLLRDLNFVKLWSAETFSVFGVQFSGLAIPWIAAETLKSSSLEMGILNALGTVPFLVFGLFVGVWADREGDDRL